MGDQNAPIKMLEFASLTCGHCARFHNEVMPQIKEKYIKNGDVLFVYNDFPLDKFAVQENLVFQKIRFTGKTYFEKSAIIDKQTSTLYMQCFRRRRNYRK